MPSIRYFRRRPDEPNAPVTSPDVGLTKISPREWDAACPRANAGVVPGRNNDGSRLPRAKLAAGPVSAGSVLGMAATVGNGVDAISTQQMIGLALPAVLLIGMGLTLAGSISVAQAADRGFQFGLQFGSNLSRVISDALAALLAGISAEAVWRSFRRVRS